MNFLSFKFIHIFVFFELICQHEGAFIQCELNRCGRSSQIMHDHARENFSWLDFLFERLQPVSHYVILNVAKWPINLQRLTSFKVARKHWVLTIIVIWGLVNYLLEWLMLTWWENLSPQSFSFYIRRIFSHNWLNFFLLEH